MSEKNSCVRTKDSKDLLFLHGYLSTYKTFIYQIKYFEKNYNVHAFDLKGFGENTGMPYPYSLDDYVDEVKEYLYKKGVKSPNVVAHSFGARVAVKGACEKYDLFSKMVLTGAAGLKPKPSIKKAIKRAVFNSLKTVVPRENLTKFYSKDYLQLDGVMKESFKLIINENLDGVLCKIQNPTLLIFGRDDKETPLYMARRYNSGIKNSDLVIIKGAGHFAFIDKPHKFNREVEEFLLLKKNVSV